MAKTKKTAKKSKGKKDMITLNLDGKKEKKDKKDKELEESGHDCEKVHPDQTHEEWKEAEDEHDKNSASEGPHGQGVEEAMSANEYRKKGIYVTDAHHLGHKGEEDKNKKIKPKKGGQQQDPGEQGTFGENKRIIGFIKNMTEKNYSQANKYLQAALNEKMKNKIRKTADELGF